MRKIIYRTKWAKKNYDSSTQKLDVNNNALTSLYAEFKFQLSDEEMQSINYYSVNCNCSEGFKFKILNSLSESEKTFDNVEKIPDDASWFQEKIFSMLPEHERIFMSIEKLPPQKNDFWISDLLEMLPERERTLDTLEKVDTQDVRVLIKTLESLPAEERIVDNLFSTTTSGTIFDDSR